MDRKAAEIERVYRARYGAFKGALATVVGSHDAARDVVQDAFAEALRSRDRFRGDGPMEAWIWRIALRIAVARKAAQTSLPLTAVGEPTLPDPEADPALANALRRLAPRRRLVVFLRYFGDLSYAAIAEICGISEGTVAATLAQARAELQSALDGEEASA